MSGEARFAVRHRHFDVRVPGGILRVSTVEFHLAMPMRGTSTWRATTVHASPLGEEARERGGRRAGLDE